MYVIIVGCGRMGAELATDLSVNGHDVVVVDKQKDAFKRLGSEFNGVTVLGTGIDEDVLKKAGVEQADAFISLTNIDNVNIMAAQIAKDIFKVPQVIARIYEPDREYVYKEFGLDTINPSGIGIMQIKNALRPNAFHRLMLLGGGDAEIIKIEVPKNFAGKKIREIEIPQKFKVFGVLRENETFIPQDDLELKQNDRLVAIIRLDAVATIQDLFGINVG